MKGRTTRKVVVIGTTNASLNAGRARTVRVALNGAGKRITSHRRLKALSGLAGCDVR